MSAGLAMPPAIGPAIRLRVAAPVLALGSLALLLLFHAEAAAAVGVWISSTAYGHGFLVLPVAAWLAWERRGAVAGQAPRPLPWVALAALPLAAAWFVAERLGIMEARQLVAVTFLLLLVLGVLGWRLWRALAVPLLYLFFLVPFGGFLVPPLQTFTAGFIDVGLDVLGIPHLVTQYIIEIPEGTFLVAEACAGLRFLIAAIAFGAVYACTIYRSPGRRIAFMAVSAVVPVIANGLRALGIVVLGHVLGSAQAGAVDHVVYGWLFFSFVIVLLILAGLPFRQDMRPAPSPAMRAADGAGDGGGPRMAVAAAAILLLTAAGPALSAVLDDRAAAEQARLGDDPGGAVLASIAVPAGCSDAGTLAAARRFTCAGIVIEARAQAFAPHASAATLIATRREATGAFAAVDATESVWTLASGQPRRWQVTQTTGPDRLVATCLWVDGVPGASGMTLRLRQGLASLGLASLGLASLGVASVVGDGSPPILLTISAEKGAETGASPALDAVLRNFLEQQEVPLPALGPRPVASRS